MLRLHDHMFMPDAAGAIAQHPVQCKVTASLAEKAGEDLLVGIQDLFRSHPELICDVMRRDEPCVERPEFVM